MCAGSEDTCLVGWNSCGTSKPAATATSGHMCVDATKPSVMGKCLTEVSGAGATQILCTGTDSLKLGATEVVKWTTTTVCAGDTECVKATADQLKFA